MTTPFISPVDVAAADRGPRPATVTVAAAFQAAAVALLLTVLGLAWAAYAQYDGWIDEAAAATHASAADISGERTSNLVGTIIASVIVLLMVVWFAVLLRPMLRGSNVGRVLSVVGAFALPGLALVGTLLSCVFGALLFMVLADGGAGFDPVAGDFPGEEFSSDYSFQDKLLEMQSSQFSWSDPIGMIILPLLVLLVAVGVLLVIPPTNRWFNPSKQVAKPFPVYFPGYAYPAHQPYQAHPAQPSYRPYQPYQGHPRTQAPQAPDQAGQPPVQP